MRAPSLSLGALLLLLILAPLASRAQADVESTLALRLSRLVSGSPCVRLLHAAGDVGCSSARGGVTGFLYLADSAADVAAFVGGAGGSSVPRVLLLPPALLTTSVLTALAGAPNFVGALLSPNDLAAGESFSPVDAVLGGNGAGGGGARAWNPAGRNLTGLRLGFPLVALAVSERGPLREAAQANAAAGYATFPAQAVSLSFYMGPAGLTSGSCLAGRSCLPLGGQSAWGSLGRLARPPRANASVPTPASPSQRPLLLAVAALDAPSLFHDLPSGADSTLSGLVALLAAALTLGATPSADSLPKQIAFGAFQGESWGGLGTRRWLADVRGFNCSATGATADGGVGGSPWCASPLATSTAFASLLASDFDAVLSVGQVGAGDSMWLHEWASPPGGGTLTPGDGSITAAATAAFAAVPAGLAPVTAVTAAIAQAAPPPGPLAILLNSSLGSAASGLRGGLLTAFDSAFTSPVYGGQYDNRSRTDAGAVTSAATLLARMLYGLASGITPPAAAAAAALAAVPAANATAVAALLDCFAFNAACPTLATLFGMPDVSSLPAGPLLLYPGVYRAPQLSADGSGYALSPGILEAAARNILALALANASRAGAAPVACRVSTDCVGTTSECFAGACANSTAYYHSAFSLGVRPDASGPNWYTFDAETLPTGDPGWAEPYWSNAVGVRLFAKDAIAVEAAALGGGIAVAIVSIAAATALIRFLDHNFWVPGGPKAS